MENDYSESSSETTAVNCPEQKSLQTSVAFSMSMLQAVAPVRETAAQALGAAATALSLDGPPAACAVVAAALRNVRVDCESVWAAWPQVPVSFQIQPPCACCTHARPHTKSPGTVLEL